MDPNTNQPLQPNPIVQPAPEPVTTAGSVPPNPEAQAPVTTNMPQAPEKKNSKTVMLLIILLILIVGMVSYVLFARNQMNNAEKAASNNNATMPPQTSTPTIAPEQDLDVSSPEADLIDLETDAKGL